MRYYKRMFQIDGQWNALHMPEKPNGFGVLIIGDANHYVNEKSSLWEEHGQRSRLLETLLKDGYTVFYSNLYGNHWGNDESHLLAREFIHFTLKKETLNPSVHVLAEGMGALTALKLMEDKTVGIRSTAFMNPCLDLNTYLKDVSETKWFYKRLLQQISEAYHVPVSLVPMIVNKQKSLNDYEADIPVKIWHSTARTFYPFSVHSRPYAQNREKLGSPITLMLHVPDKQFYYNKAICSFFHDHEKKL